MKVGDLVTGTPATSPYFGERSVGIIVGINPLDGRFMVQWNDLHRPYPEPRHYLEVINESR
jgi:hypothetical protein